MSELVALRMDDRQVCAASRLASAPTPPHNAAMALFHPLGAARAPDPEFF